MTVSILLFAAGLGTRMRHLTQDRPKPLIPVAGTTLLDHALELTKVPFIGTRIVNVHHKADMIRTHLTGRGVEISDETALLKDTGGGLRQALPMMASDPVMTMNTDAVWQGPNPLEILQNSWRDDMQALLLMVPPTRVFGHKGAGDFQIGGDGRLTRAAADVYTGLQMIRPHLAEAVDEDVFSMNLLWDRAAKAGALFGCTYPGAWCDVGQPESIPLAENMLMHDV